MWWDVGPVGLDGAGRDVEPVGNRVVGHAQRDELEDLGLAFGEFAAPPSETSRWGFGSEERGPGGGVDVEATRGDLADSPDELNVGGFFDEVADAPASEARRR